MIAVSNRRARTGFSACMLLALAASIVAPSILVQEMEVKKTERKPERLPYLKHPYFAEKK